jgi:hypothetical protein
MRAERVKSGQVESKERRRQRMGQHHLMSYVIQKDTRKENSMSVRNQAL